MTKYLWDLYKTSEKNNCTDLAIDAKAMLLHDARTGERKYTDEQTDIKALHADAAELEAQENELMQFIGRHNRELAKAFALGSRTAFDQVVAQCIADDQEREEQSEEQPKE